MSQLLVSEADIDDLFGLYENFSQDNDENVAKRWLRDRFCN